MRGQANDEGVAVGVAVASSAQARLASSEAYSRPNSPGKLLPSSYEGKSYVSATRLDVLRERLSERDMAVIRDVARLRLATSTQLERLHFADVSAVVRRRVLGRLVQWRVLTTLERRVGGVRAGSAGLVFALDLAGQRLAQADDRARRPRQPGVRHVRHVLAVAELYVSLVEWARGEDWRLETFQAEPASWWPDERGGVLKPDAYLVVTGPEHTDHYWAEVDLATEHLPTLKRKLAVYLEFWRGGQLGPEGVMPRVLVTVPDAERYSGVVRLIHQLPSGAENLIIVALAKDAAEVIVRCLNQSD
jgi:Replication-relaxation